MRRQNLALATASLCALMLSGCSSPTTSNSQQPSTTQASVGTSQAPSAASTTASNSQGQPPAECGPVDGADFLCGVTNVEQLISIDGTRWAVGSSAAGGPGKLEPLYFLNLDTKAATPLDPTTVKVAADKAAYPDCPGPANFDNLQSLGIDYEKVNGRDTLTVISHGGGLTIQVFEMTRSAAVPALTWIGCVLPPDEHFWPDAAATLPDGGMLVTSLFDPVDPDYVAALNSGQPYGMLGE